VTDAQTEIAELASRKLERMMRWTVKKELLKLPSLLHEGERVVNLAQGMYADKNGLIAVTDRRVMFVEEGVMPVSRTSPTGASPRFRRAPAGRRAT